jgi:hypothetical protein
MFAIGCSFLLYNGYWKHTQLPVIQQAKLSFSDYILMFLLLIEFVEQLMLGPDLVTKDIGGFVRNASETVYEAIFDPEGTIFWQVIWVSIAIMLVTMFQFLFMRFGLRDVFPTQGLLSLGKEICDITIPIFAFVFFQPVFVYIGDLYECTETSNDNYENAYLIRDCEE